jgi:hypothetical protein
MGTGRTLFYEEGPHFMISQDDGMKIKPYLDQGVTVSISPGHKLEVSMKDSTGETIEASFRVVVSPYTSVSGVYATDDSIKGDPGILAYVTQISASQSESGTHLHDNAWRKALTQFNGKLLDPDGAFYLNEADIDSVEEWSYYPEIIQTVNLSQDAPADAGTFNATGGKEDQPIPGIPVWYDSNRLILLTSSGIKCTRIGGSILAEVHSLNNFRIIAPFLNGIYVCLIQVKRPVWIQKFTVKLGQCLSPSVVVKVRSRLGLRGRYLSNIGQNPRVALDRIIGRINATHRSIG